MAKTLMIQGTSSNVGKSLITAALCRIFKRKGVNVVPFKAQNMALNSFVTPEGHEIGRAQVVQAQAAGLSPHVDMNPILLKPEADSFSQVVLMGKPWKNLPAGEYYKESVELWAAVAGALERLHSRHELIVIEGAGSPAEINLNKYEIVNMRVARHLNAPVLLAGDIDRGGIFAQLYGTLELLKPEERKLVKGFIVNKFRGDVKLLEPGIDMLTELAGGVPTLGIVPYLRDIRLAQEDSVFLDENSESALRDGNAENTDAIDVAVIRLPHISNYDDFDPLQHEDGVRVRFVDRAKTLGAPDAVIIPGSKTTVADLNWLQDCGLADIIKGLSKAGVPVFGVCGGYQMLGTFIDDPEGIEGRRGRFTGLGLLPVETVFSGQKETAAGKAVVCGTGETVNGYEIHMGRSLLKDGAEPLLKKPDGSYDGCVSGNVCGTYFHGIFDNDDYRRTWLKSIGWRALPGKSFFSLREEELDRLADNFESALDMELLLRIIGF
ncbi:MAG: cobyric acid synthase [Spirochaetales bacterium]|uniref:Cobyric acid synthase n=1 Tax=Candidatus Thalassospirochaeta sargassi TaxID=3119039 RepID=A0AAJ1MKH9_9SPIO|nr:cobyric acid synthase [Spirochaetales bacterium]